MIATAEITVNLIGAAMVRRCLSYSPEIGQ